MPENHGLKIKAIVPNTWVSMPEIQVIVPRNQDQCVCCHRQMPEGMTVCMESGLRCLKSRQMWTEIMARVLQNAEGENQGQYAYNMGQYS